MCTLPCTILVRGRRLELTAGRKLDTPTSVASGEHLDFCRQMSLFMIFPQLMSLVSFSKMHEKGWLCWCGDLELIKVILKQPQSRLAEPLIQQTLANIQANCCLPRLAIDDKRPARRPMPTLGIPAQLLNNRPQPRSRQAETRMPPAEFKQIGRAHV